MAKSIIPGSDTFWDARGVVIDSAGTTLANALGYYFFVIDRGSETDFNNFKTMGVKWVNNTSAAGSRYTNAPGTSAYNVLTFCPLSTHGVQFAIEFNNSAMYRRTKASGTWSSWITM